MKKCSKVRGAALSFLTSREWVQEKGVPSHQNILKVTVP